MIKASTNLYHRPNVDIAVDEHELLRIALNEYASQKRADREYALRRIRAGMRMLCWVALTYKYWVGGPSDALKKFDETFGRD